MFYDLTHLRIDNSDVRELLTSKGWSLSTVGDRTIAGIRTATEGDRWRAENLIADLHRQEVGQG